MAPLELTKAPLEVFNAPLEAAKAPLEVGDSDKTGTEEGRREEVSIDTEAVDKGEEIVSTASNGTSD